MSDEEAKGPLQSNDSYYHNLNDSTYSESGGEKPTPLKLDSPILQYNYIIDTYNSDGNISPA